MKKIQGQIHLDVQSEYDRNHYKFRLVPFFINPVCDLCGNEQLGDVLVHIYNRLEVLRYCSKCKAVFFPFSLYEKYSCFSIMNEVFSNKTIKKVSSKYNRVLNLKIKADYQLTENTKISITKSVPRKIVDKNGYYLIVSRNVVVDGVELTIYIDRTTETVCIDSEQFLKHSDILIKYLDEKSYPVAYSLLNQKVNERNEREAERRKIDSTARSFYGIPLGNSPKQRKHSFFS